MMDKFVVCGAIGHHRIAEVNQVDLLKVASV